MYYITKTTNRPTIIKGDGQHVRPAIILLGKHRFKQIPNQSIRNYLCKKPAERPIVIDLDQKENRNKLFELAASCPIDDAIDIGTIPRHHDRNKLCCFTRDSDKSPLVVIRGDSKAVRMAVERMNDWTFYRVQYHNLLGHIYYLDPPVIVINTDYYDMVAILFTAGYPFNK